MIDRNILRGEKVRLTSVEKDDLPTLARWHEDAGFARLFDATPAVPRSQSHWEKQLEKQQDQPDGFVFAIRPRDGRTLLGYAELDGILWNQGNGWIGIGLGERANWGRGFGREAMELLLRFAFHELNLHRVQLTVFGYNERAIALYEGLGFQREGTFREHLQRDGQRFDMILYGLLRSEWAGRQTRLT